MDSPKLYLSDDKALYSNVFKDRRYIHIRRYFRRGEEGEFAPKKEGVALHTDEWAEFLHLSRAIDQTHSESTWDISSRVYVWKQVGGSVQFVQRTIEWKKDEDDDTYQISGELKKSITLSPMEWRNLHSMARDVVT